MCRIRALALVIFYLQIAFIITYSTCSTRKSLLYNNFHLLRKCQRSTETVVGLGYFKSNFECARMTYNSKGLAFNFAPSGRGKINLSNISVYTERGKQFPWKSTRRHILEQPEEFYNCIALQCPEKSNFATLVNDSRFDYYSLYTNAPPPENSTCLREVGVFQLYMKPQNYSSAFSICAIKSQGALAHIISEERTVAVSSFLEAFSRNNSTNHLKLAYVGLNFSIEGGTVDYMTSEGESLTCFKYRAWAPGYPREKTNFSCVAITLDNSWITTDCHRKLPFVCEIYTSSSGVVDNRTSSNCINNNN